MQNLNSIQNNPYINQNDQQNMQNQCPQCVQTQNNANFTNVGNNAIGQNNCTQNSNAQTFNTQNPLSKFINSGNAQNDFLKGAAIGAIATFILTNESAQKAIFKGFAKISQMLEIGFEEMKERYEDVRAEMDCEE